MANPLLDRSKSKAQTLIIDVVPRRMRVHQISEGEIENIANSGNSLNQLFFGCSIGASLSLLTTVITVPISSPYTHATFILMTWFTAGATIFFGARTFVDSRRVTTMMKSYREKPVGPPST